jgi:hypothetical protein
MAMLDCTDRESALGTASAVLGIPAEQLERVCRRIDPDNRSTGDFLRELGRASLPGAFHGATVRRCMRLCLGAIPNARWRVALSKVAQLTCVG